MYDKLMPALVYVTNVGDDTCHGLGLDRPKATADVRKWLRLPSAGLVCPTKALILTTRATNSGQMEEHVMGLP